MRRSGAFPGHRRAARSCATSRETRLERERAGVGPDAIPAECASGGRVEGTDVYRFTYFGADGRQRWELEVRERQIHDIASGALFELDATPLDPNTRTHRGEPLLVWGEYDDDALRVRTLGDLATALDVLAGIGGVMPA